MEFHNSSDDSDRDFELLIELLPLREPSTRLDDRMQEHFQGRDDHHAEPPYVSLKSSHRGLHLVARSLLAISLIALGIFLGRLSVTFENSLFNLPKDQRNSIAVDEAIPVDDPSLESQVLSKQALSKQVLSKQVLSKQVLSKTNPSEVSTIHRFQTMPVVVGEELMVIDGVPMKKLHLVSTERIRTYDEVEKRYETKLRSKSQFVLTPDPGA